jgi:hypothetical protein
MRGTDDRPFTSLLKASSFWDTAGLSPHGDWPGRRGNSSLRTAKPVVHQRRLHAALALKPTRRLPKKRIDAGCCCNKFHSWDNKHSRPALRRQATVPGRQQVIAPGRRQALVAGRRSSAQARQDCNWSVSTGAQHSIRSRLCQNSPKVLLYSWKEDNPEENRRYGVLC